MVEFQRDGGVARIFLNRPQKVNALDSALLDELAAWLVLTGEPIDAERAHAWGLAEQISAPGELDQTVSQVIDSLLAGDGAALRMQKELLQMWDELPLADAVTASVGRFAGAYAAGG